MASKICVACLQKDQSKGIAYHKFPTDELRQVWINSLKLDENELTASSVICSGHFLPADFVTHGRRKLLSSTAVPVPILSRPVIEKATQGSSSNYDSDGFESISGIKKSPSTSDLETSSVDDFERLSSSEIQCDNETNSLDDYVRLKLEDLEIQSESQDDIRAYEWDNIDKCSDSSESCDSAPKNNKDVEDDKNSTNSEEIVNENCVLDKCNYCNFTGCGEEIINRHMIATHSIHVCEYCGSHQKNLLKHIAQHSGTFTYHCSACYYTAKVRHDMEEHMETKHSLFAPHPYFTVASNRVLLKPEGYKCEDCSFHTDTEHELQDHVIHSHDKRLDKACRYCDYKTPDYKTFNYHMHKNHSVLYLFICPDCDYATDSYYTLDKHNRIHSTLKMYECKSCENFGSKFPSILKNHIETKHKLVALKCPQCYFVTSLEDDLKQHVRMWHAKKNFKCHFCCYETNYSRRLRKHIDAAHPETKRGKTPVDYLRYMADVCPSSP